MGLIHSSQADTQNISHLHVTFIVATEFASLLPSMALEDVLQNAGLPSRDYHLPLQCLNDAS